MFLAFVVVGIFIEHLSEYSFRRFIIHESDVIMCEFGRPFVPHFTIKNILAKTTVAIFHFRYPFQSFSFSETQARTIVAEEAIKMSVLKAPTSLLMSPMLQLPGSAPTLNKT